MESRHSTQNSMKSETSEPALLFPTDIRVILNFYKHERFGVGWERFSWWCFISDIPFCWTKITTKLNQPGAVAMNVGRRMGSLPLFSWVVVPLLCLLAGVSTAQTTPSGTQQLSIQEAVAQTFYLQLFEAYTGFAGLLDELDNGTIFLVRISSRDDMIMRR